MSSLWHSAAGGGGPGKIDTATSRRAVQAAAGALALACPCDKIVMCAVLAPPDQLAQVLSIALSSCALAFASRPLYVSHTM